MICQLCPDYTLKMQAFDFGQLDGLSRDQLEAIQTRIAAILRKYDERERREASKRIDELAAAHGIDLTSLSRAPPPPAYRNPQNEFETWSGRGRKPHWVISHLARGGDMSELQIS